MILRQGGIIAYPTEAVYGLGCDPNNEIAVQRLLKIKRRAVSKGLLLIAAHWQQLEPFVELSQVSTLCLRQAQATWPGPYTWLIPASNQTSTRIRGNHASVGVRVTAFPIARSLCQVWGGALVSTSANRSNQSPARTQAEVIKIFHDEIDYLVPGRVGEHASPTEIRDILTNAVVRSGS
jgi:L-threonylcarbamoyladenylate synthase